MFLLQFKKSQIPHPPKKNSTVGDNVECGKYDEGKMLRDQTDDQQLWDSGDSWRQHKQWQLKDWPSRDGRDRGLQAQGAAYIKK